MPPSDEVTACLTASLPAQGARLHSWAQEREARLEAKRQLASQAEASRLRAQAVPTRSRQDFKLTEFLERQDRWGVGIWAMSRVVRPVCE
jgi:hypothetical protein